MFCKGVNRVRKGREEQEDGVKGDGWREKSYKE